MAALVGPPAAVTAVAIGLRFAFDGTEGWRDLASGAFVLILAAGFAIVAGEYRLWERPFRGLAVAAAYLLVMYWIMMGAIIYLGTIILGALGEPVSF